MSAADEEENARRERARAVGMFRYQLIRDAADPGLSSMQRGRMVRAIAGREHIDPAGRSVRYSRDHLDRWIRMWRRGGFDALVPAGRQPYARTDLAVLEVAMALKRERPARTTAQITRILRTQTGWSPSETTLLRHFHRAGLQVKLTPEQAGQDPGVFGRFEADRCNELWTGDALHGPKVAGRKTYLFAFIDDHSRLIVGHRWGFAEDTVRLAAALRPALAARGVPNAVYVDNGSAFVDAWLLRACAKLGIRLTHSTPGRPQGRGKIERFFRTVNDQFLVEITPTSTETGSGRTDTTQVGTGLGGDDPVAGLLELNRLFTAWVEQVYHRAWHSETGQTPLARWAASWADIPPAQPGAPMLREAFMWEARRLVTKTATVAFHSNHYQVEHALIGRTVELVYDPFDLTHIEVRYQGRPMGIAVPQSIKRHSHPKARPETPQPPPAPTGINYLGLIAAAHQEHLATGVNYAALTTSPAGTPAADPPTTPGSDPMPQTMPAGLTTAASSPESSHRPDLESEGQIRGQLDLTDLLHPEPEQQHTAPTKEER